MNDSFSLTISSINFCISFSSVGEILNKYFFKIISKILLEYSNAIPLYSNNIFKIII